MSLLEDWARLDPFDLDGEGFAALYAALMVVAWMICWLWRDVVRTAHRRPDMRDLCAVEVAYCAGGIGRAADTLYLVLAMQGAARLDERDRIVADGATPVISTAIDAFRAELAGTRTRRAFRTAFAASTAYEAMRERLLGRKILLRRDRRGLIDLATLVPGLALFAFGGIEIIIGFSRGESLAPLAALMTVTAIAVIAAKRRETYLTREATASFEALRASAERTMRASSPAELGFAFAMNGASALANTPHAGFARLAKSWI